MPRKRTLDSPQYTPAVFRWARDRAGYSVEGAAIKMGVRSQVLADWENETGELTPTVNQARELATLYGRSFLEWFLPTPPEIPVPDLIPDFRIHRDADDPRENRELLGSQMWAETQRDNALDLYSEIGETPPEFPVHATLDNDVENIARLVREAMQFPIEQQAGRLTVAQRSEIPRIIRDKIESLGVLTLRRPDLKRFGVRGFCIAKFPLPAIVFTSESPNAQAFTLAHELGHIIIRQSAISGSMTRHFVDNNVGVAEAWCNSFAAAFLIPRATVLARYAIPNEPKESISDSQVSELANYFGVSAHAMLIRLVELRYVEPSYYWDVKKEIYEAEERAFKAFGRPKFYGRRYSSSLGTLYTSLVMEAWDMGRITNHNAAEFMGIKNLSHLHDIRVEYGT